jgi:hypothetical protein
VTSQKETYAKKESYMTPNSDANGKVPSKILLPRLKLSQVTGFEKHDELPIHNNTIPIL